MKSIVFHLYLCFDLLYIGTSYLLIDAKHVTNLSEHLCSMNIYIFQVSNTFLFWLLKFLLLFWFILFFWLIWVWLRSLSACVAYMQNIINNVVLKSWMKKKKILWMSYRIGYFKVPVLQVEKWLIIFETEMNPSLYFEFLIIFFC